MPLAIINARLASPDARSPRLFIQDDVTIVIDAGRIESAVVSGPIPAGAKVVDAGGRLVSPGLVDCHTHAHFLGDRAEEFGRRAAGATYLEIAKAGGGIQSTVRATRAGTLQQRIDSLRQRLHRLLINGVTTVEVKTGYGLSVETEIQFLHELQFADGEHIDATLMAAHAIPPEAQSPEARREWVRSIAEVIIPRVAKEKLAKRVDMFVEQSAYTPDEARIIAHAAKANGLALHMHVDQLTSGGGAELAAELGAQAVSHLEKISDAGIAALRSSGTVAVLLPTATLAAGEPAFAPARKLVDAGVPIALATNLNPGTAPTESTSLMFFLAAVGLHLTPEEILWAATRGGALALGREKLALIDPGAPADLIVWNATNAAHLAYHAAINHVRVVIRDGEVMVDRSDEADGACEGVL